MNLMTQKNVVMNHKKIIRIMRKYRLFTKIRRINPYKAIMEKTREHKSFANILDRQFTQAIPYTVFCTDITYLPFNHRLAYFSAVKDIASGEVVGWNLSKHIGMEVVMDTLEHMKVTTSLPLTNVLIHSDQGFHYTSPRYINMVKSLGMVQSMSRKGRCIDNAPMESFFGHLKDDVDYQDCKTFEELLMLITEYVRYYNNDRQQWNLKKMTPVNYRNHLLALQT
jgi:putative transposase